MPTHQKSTKHLWTGCLLAELINKSLLLLKEDKDLLNSSSYRPISVLDVDAGLLANVLVTHLERVLPTSISWGQTGFIKNRLFKKIFDNYLTQ